MTQITPVREPIIPIGAQFMLLSALGFSLMSACVKYVSIHGIPVFEIVAARALVSLIISYLDVKRKGISIWGTHKKLLIARGSLGTLALMCVYYALTTLPLAEATVLQYTYPVFTAVLGWLVLKEKISGATFTCISLSILGLIVMVSPNFSANLTDELPIFSVLIALLGASASSVAYIVVKTLSTKEDSSVIIFYFPMIALPVSLVMMLINNSFVMPDIWLIGVLILLGIFTQVGQFALTKAMQSQAASKASAYSYVQIVFSTLLGFILFSEIPSLWTYLGGGLIICGALINLKSK